jgi:phosphopentomutase
MAEEDVCVVVSDHGCDPTHSGSDHTREYAILLVFGKGIISACDLGIRGSFADCGKSIADFLGIDGSSLDGESFAEQITRHCRKHDL